MHKATYIILDQGFYIFNLVIRSNGHYCVQLYNCATLKRVEFVRKQNQSSQN